MGSLSEKARDPVCGMSVDPGSTEYVSGYQGNDFYFCAEACLKAFEKNPGMYLKGKQIKQKGFWGRYLDRLNRGTEGKALKCH
jgi:YHS domain-containing protein